MTVKYQIIIHEIGYRTHKIGSRTHTGLFSSFARNLRAFRGRGGCIVRARFPPKEGVEVFACPLSLQQLPPAHACAFGRGIPQAVGPGREEERRPGVRAAILRGTPQGARIVLPIVGNGAEIGNRHRRFRGPAPSSPLELPPQQHRLPLPRTKYISQKTSFSSLLAKIRMKRKHAYSAPRIDKHNLRTAIRTSFSQNRQEYCYFPHSRRR